jgi:hypothetical protein
VLTSLSRGGLGASACDNAQQDGRRVSEPHRIVKMVAPFTVLIDSGSRWHMSKLKRVKPPQDKLDMVPDDDDDMEQASDKLPATPGDTTAPASSDGGHGGQYHRAQPDVLRRSSYVSAQYQLGKRLSCPGTLLKGVR